MSKNLSIFSFIFIISLIFAEAVFAQEEFSPQEIVKRADDLLRGDTSRGRYVMTVVTSAWQRRLELDAFSQARDKTFIRIISPVKEAGITTLRIRENMWNYLPNVERTIKIPPSMMLQPWMGSDFANDDLVKESSIVYDYTHTILGQESIGQDVFYKIQLLPKPQAPVVWGKIIFWISKDGFIPLREEFYNEAGKLIKVLDYSRVQQISDRKIPCLWKMSSMVKEGRYTTIEVKDIVYNQPIDENIFTLGNLKREK
jgi:outer membrane lipoprotein-sorting protein